MASSPLPWSDLFSLLDELLELEGPARDERLAEITAREPALAAELQRLMALEDSRPDFLAQPVIDAAVFAPQAGQEIGPYRLIMPLGEGGMGQVWLAMRADGLYERRVALKLLRAGLGGSGLRARFTRERQILARLGHAHIARLLDAGVSADGQPYLALDYVRGDPITAHARTQNLDVPTRLDLFAQVCAAVSHAHANLVVHRDLKPSNILVTPAGEVCLLDFGIAKLLDQPQGGGSDITQADARAFTLHYAAPEQLRGEVVTTMTDVYALGVVLYELLTDRKPYEVPRQSDAAWEDAILNTEPLRPSLAATRLARETGLASDQRRARALAGDLDNIVLKAMAKQPDQRYSSVEALAQDLRRHRDGQPVQARPQSFGYRASKYLRRHAIGVGLGFGVSLILAVALAVVTWQANRALKEASRAQAMQDFVIALFENGGSGGNNQSLDVRGLLDAGVRRADSELATQPRARAELLGLIARLRSGLGDDREALSLLDRQLELLRILGTEAPENLRLESAALRGRSLRELGRAEECLQVTEPLLSTADHAANAYPQVVAEFYSQVGRCQRQQRGTPDARALFDKALQLRRGLPDGKALQAESQTDLALLLLDQGRAREAISALRDALAVLRDAGGERNALGVDIWRDLGEAYGRINNAVESEAAYRQALDIALARFGTSHPRTAAVQAPLAALLADRGKLDEASSLLELSRSVAQARWGPDSAEIAGLDARLGQLALARGQAADARAALGNALRIWRNLGRDALASRDQCLLAEAVLADAEAGARERATALTDCRQALSAQPAEVAASAQAAVALAEIDRGDGAQAQRWLEPYLGPAAAVTDPGLLLALARWNVGRDDNAAEARLQALLAQDAIGPGNGAAARRIHWQAQALQADLMCRRGELVAGTTLRDQIWQAAAASDGDDLRLAQRLHAFAAACAPTPGRG